MQRNYDASFTVLLVCTGNICRSALAERLGRAYLNQQLGAEAGAVRVVSAGTQGVVGSAMHPDSALVLRGFGAEAGDFVARRLTPAIVAQADLVLTMTRRHRDEVMRLAPRALPRTFTLLEAADVAAVLGGQISLPGGTFTERAAKLVKAMAGNRSGAPGGPQDVPDPIGRPIQAHEAAGELIAAALLPILDRLVQLFDEGSVRRVGRSGAW